MEGEKPFPPILSPRPPCCLFARSGGGGGCGAEGSGAAGGLARLRRRYGQPPSPAPRVPLRLPGHGPGAPRAAGLGS